MLHGKSKSKTKTTKHKHMKNDFVRASNSRLGLGGRLVVRAQLCAVRLFGWLAVLETHIV